MIDPRPTPQNEKKTGAILVAPYGLQFNMKSVYGYPEKQATVATGVGFYDHLLSSLAREV